MPGNCLNHHRSTGLTAMHWTDSSTALTAVLHQGATGVLTCPLCEGLGAQHPGGCTDPG
jgi:hypothetical protein